MSGLRIVVVGDESLTVQCAEQMLERGHEIVTLVTSEAPLVAWALAHNVPILASGPGLNERLNCEFDYLLSIANLRMLPVQLLERAKLGAVNFHDGPLPKYAGLNSPIWALLGGEEEHGVSWHVMLAEADTGNILVQELFALEPDDTALTINARCYEVALSSFTRLAPLLETKDLSGTAQKLDERSYFARDQRPAHLALLDLTQPAETLASLVRALNFGNYKNPLTRPKLLTEQGVVYVGQAELLNEGDPLPAGQLGAVGAESLTFGTATDAIIFSKLRDANGKNLTSEQALQALQCKTGESCTTPADAKEKLDSLKQWSAHEALWAKRLARFESTPAPLAQWESQPAKAAHAKSPETTPLGHWALASLNASAPELVAGFALWLSRMNSSERVCWLSSDASVNLGGVAKLFATCVPSALTIDANASFSALVAKAEAELERLRSKGRYPLDLIGRTPELLPAESDVGIELSGELPSLDGRRLVLALGSEGPQFAYDTDTYSEATMQRIAAQFEQLVHAGKQDSNKPVAELPLITDEGRALLLNTFNATQVTPASDWPATVHGGFEAQVLLTPQKIACVFEDKELSYQALNERANQLAHRLVQQGVTRDTLVGIHLPRCDDLLVAVLGILKAGGAYLPLDPGYPAERLQHMLSDSKAHLVVTRQDVAPQFECSIQTLMLDESTEPRTNLTESPGVDVAPEQLAYVIYTSGSTGKPKGVMLEHRQVTNFFLGMDNRIPRFEDDCWLAVTSLSFDISVLELLWTLARGFRVVLAPENRAELSSGVSTGGLDLDFSLFYFSSDASVEGKEKYRLLLEGARFADTHDFKAVWTPERHFAAFGGLYPNPSVTSAAIAAITENIQIRGGSCVLPLHNPIRVAEEWSVVDNLSGGRVGISVAAGWHPHDFVLNKDNFKDRKNVMLRDVEVLRTLWAGESVAIDSPVGKVDIKTLPRPVQKELPLWLTSASNVETFEAAARLKAGVLTHLLGQSLEELRGKIRAYRREWQRCGHEGEGSIVLMLHTFVGKTDAEAKEIVREPMKTYLGSALSLIAEHAWSFPAFKQVARSSASMTENFNNLSPEDTDALLDYSFERYYETAGLFGSSERCQQTLRELHASGIDEVACLIDFGVDTDTVLEQLPLLNEVRIAATSPVQVKDGDYSLAAQVYRHKVTHLQCTPSMAQMLLLNEGTQASLGQIRSWMLGGEALPPSLVSEIRKSTGAELLNMYGPTETTVWSCTDTVNSDTVSLGTAIANTQLYVLDDRGQLLPPGAPGELFIAGDGVARGYFERPDLNAERFLPDPFVQTPSARMYKTGDRVCFDSQGKLEFLGRLDHQVKLRGHRIELGEIEVALCRIEAVREAVAIVREDAPGDMRLVAYYLLRKDHKTDAQQLKRTLSDALPEAMVPAHYVELGQFPLTPNAKVDRKALPAPVAAAAPESSNYSAPTGDLEGTITGVWQDVLGVAQFGATDNFFEQGGHSLLVVQVHRKLTAALEISLSITDIFRYSTARSLAEHLGGQGSTDRADETKNRADARREAMGRRGALRRARRS